MRRLAGLLLAGALIAPVTPARAAHDGLCGTIWTKPATCQIKVGGLRLRVWGTATASGTASLRVWVTSHVIGANEVTILECSASDADGSTGCANDVGLSLGRPVSEVVLLCHVTGSAAGTYYCESFAG